MLPEHTDVLSNLLMSVNVHMGRERIKKVRETKQSVMVIFSADDGSTMDTAALW